LRDQLSRSARLGTDALTTRRDAIWLIAAIPRRHEHGSSGGWTLKGFRVRQVLETYHEGMGAARMADDPQPREWLRRITAAEGSNAITSSATLQAAFN
jgi:hypothetical protein